MPLAPDPGRSLPVPAACLALVMLAIPACGPPGGAAGAGDASAPPGPADGDDLAGPPLPAGLVLPPGARTGRTGSPAGIPQPAPPPGAAEGLTASGWYVVRWRTEPAAPPLGRLFEVRTDVVDVLTGRAFDGAEVKVDARMPAHGHGMETAPETEPARGGGYLTRGMKFHMPGEWTVLVQIGGERPDRVELRRVVE